MRAVDLRPLIWRSAREPERFEEPPAPPREGRGEPRRAVDLRWTVGVGLLLVVAFALRAWGVKHGLPYAYNADENAHFVPKAIGLFGHSLNPQYFINPPAYTYVLHVVFAVWFGGRKGVSDSFAADPTDVFTVARLTAGALGTLAVWLLYLAGKRLFDDRRVGLLAAGTLAFAFLPVFYSHLALNDVPTLAPLCLCLWATAGILRHGRRRDYLLAGLSLGLACATKYTAGIVLLGLLAAAVAQSRRERQLPGARRAAIVGTGLAGAAAAAGFFVGNPYAVLDFDQFWKGLQHQTSTAGGELGKLGQTEDNGVAYYLWTLTWGLGWAPAIAAAAGVVVTTWKRPAVAAILVPAPVVFLLFMGTQERFFGRWLMPIFPLLCLLGAFAVVQLASAIGRRRPALMPTLVAAGAALLWVQGIASSIHLGQVLSREDTRNITRQWLVENVPPRSRIVVEPVVPDAWAQDVGNPSPLSANGNRWQKFPTSRSKIANDGSLLPGKGRLVNIEDYERTLYPGLVDTYVEQGFCWVVSGFTQRGRAEVEPEAVPRALAYYRELERRSTRVFYVSPYRRGAKPVRFNFDWTFDYYPRAYYRPGPEMWVYRLKGGRC